MGLTVSVGHFIDSLYQAIKRAFFFLGWEGGGMDFADVRASVLQPCLTRKKVLGELLVGLPFSLLHSWIIWCQYEQLVVLFT